MSWILEMLMHLWREMSAFIRNFGWPHSSFEAKLNYFLLAILMFCLASATTTTVAPYCATTCTGSFNPSVITTTCSLYCDDGGVYYCRNNSTYCAGLYYSPSGFGFCDPASSRYTGPCNTTGYCCVYDNFYPDYYCLSKSSCGFSG